MPPPLDITSFLYRVTSAVLNPFIVLLFVVALLTFFWGLVGLIVGAGNEEHRAVGKRHLMWGIVGMLIMFTVYGIISLLLSTFGIAGPDYLKGII